MGSRRFGLLGAQVQRRQTTTTASSGFDTSAYRTDTYGAPTHYVDVTKTVSGDGSLGDPWTVSQSLTQPVAGNRVGWLPLNECANGTIVRFNAPQSSRTPAFQSSNSGTSGNPILHVTKYAASWLVAQVGKASVGSDGRRTEIRHAGDPATITAGGAGGTNDTGGPIIGADAKNHIWFDGFYWDLDECEIREDSGTIGVNNAATGIRLYNFAIKGKTVGVASNPVIYGSHDAIDTVLSNFYVWDFKNSASAGGNQSSTPQPGLLSDQYGDRNFLIEKFDCDNGDRGWFCKGSSGVGQESELNYGTYQYGRVSRTSMPFAFNAMDTTQISYVRYCLGYDTREQLTEPDFGGDGLTFDTISAGQQNNVEFDHVTIAKIHNGINTNGAFYVDDDNGLDAEPNGVKLTNSILDIDTGSNVFLIRISGTNDLEVCNRNYYRRPNGIIFSRNGSSRTFTEWKNDTGLDANSNGTTNTDPFVDRANDDYRVSGGHAAATLSSTGGPVGCFDENNYTIGVVS